MSLVMPRWLGSLLLLALSAPAGCAPRVSQVPLGVGPLALAESAAAPAHASSKPQAPPHRSTPIADAESDDSEEDEKDEASDGDKPASDEAKNAAAGDAKAPADAQKATKFKGMYAGTDIATYRLEGLPDQRQEDDRAKIRVEADGDDTISIVIVSSDTGEDLCELSASISGKVATLVGSEPCFTNPDDDSISATITGGRATLNDDELKLQAEGTMSMNVAEQSLSGTISYTFKGKRQ